MKSEGSIYSYLFGIEEKSRVKRARRDVRFIVVLKS